MAALLGQIATAGPLCFDDAWAAGGMERHALEAADWLGGVRARRLARALISDLAAYNPERQQQGLQEGRLKELFKDDLKKSWQEYVEQVGLEMAKGTPFFRDALNEIPAKGTRGF